MQDHLTPLIRHRIHIRGLVQGVGFRPFIYRLASDMKLGGWVRNDGAGVELEIQGESADLERFLQRLRTEAPPASRIDHIEKRPVPALDENVPFVIAQSATGLTSTAISPDTAVCPDCLDDMFSPANRRYRHPFTHCVQCGPRYTITARLPYDRINTSMAAFAECEDCRTERERPDNRRFHAQTNACHACGPRLWLSDSAGQALAAGDVIAEALSRLLRGEILAIKGVGGYHLACDARNADAVRRLRERKAREEKPFALMLANTASAQEFAHAGEADLTLLASPQRPIVLLPKRDGCDARLPGVAPGLASLGVMLPCTPVQYLMFHEAAGRPAGTRWLADAQSLALVMTSANPHGEPLVTDNQQALSQLAHIADAFLMHDRDILIRCDDSVLRPNAAARAPQFARRARGYVPTAVSLGFEAAPGLATGGYLNNTICITRGSEAFLSEHIGDLDTRTSCEAFGATVAHLLDILEVEPQWIAADLHPDFHSTRFAQVFAAENRLPFIEVQHHHAHIGAVLAEHRQDGPMLGIALDGYGLGADRTAWGGELLLVDGARCERLGHLHPLPLPGGDRAAREPWRMGAAALSELGQRDDIVRRYGPTSAMIAQMLDKGLNTPRTSSAGRLFDAAAGLLSVKPVTSYEGQAAAMLEGLATGFGEVEPMAPGHAIDGMTLNMMPLLARLAEMQDVPHAAALFHATFAAGLAEWVLRAAARNGIDRVAFGGGCFFNGVLSRILRERLEAQGLRVFEATLVPPGDGGLSLGQAWVALKQLAA